MIVHVLAGKTLEPGDLHAQRLVVRVEAPDQAGEPTDACLDQRYAQPGVSLEGAVANERDEMGHHRGREERVPLDVVGRPARSARGGHRAAAVGANVDPDDETELLGGFEDRPVPRIAVAGVCTAREKHLDDLRAIAHASDFSGSADGILCRNHERALQTGIA